MFVAELSPEYKEKLREFGGTIQENFIRAFKNEAVRNQRIRSIVKTEHKMDSILLSLDDTKIELNDLKLIWLPDFRIANFDLDLTKLNIDLELKLGDLKLEGLYDVNNLALQKLLPVTNCGKLGIDFSQVICQGRVGLSIQGDSFVPLNYDVTYHWAQTDITVKYFVSNDSQIENKITQTPDEKSLGHAVWQQLDGLLTQLLHEQLASVVTEFSVAESLADEDEQLKNFATSQSSKANRIFDSLLCSAKDYLLQKQLRTIETEPFNVAYRGTPTHYEQGVFRTDNGYIQDLSSLSRLHDSSIYDTDNQRFIYGYLNLRDFKHGYTHFISKFEDTEVEGDIKSTIYENKIFIKFSEDRNDPSSIKKIEVLKTKVAQDMDVDTSGLASLSWLVPKVQSWTIGHFRTNAVPVLEKVIEEAFMYAIDLEWKKDHQVGDLNELNNFNTVFWKNVFMKNTFH